VDWGWISGVFGREGVEAHVIGGAWKIARRCARARCCSGKQLPSMDFEGSGYLYEVLRGVSSGESWWGM
jgi:hypothetical protein